MSSARTGSVTMRRFAKFLHTMGAIGLMGAMACLIVLHGLSPAPAQISEYALIRGAMGEIATWIFMPSLALTLLSGLMAIAINRAFHNAGWAWVKLASGVLMFEYGLIGVQGPMQQEAELAARVLGGQTDATELAVSVGGERMSLWILLGVATFNVVFGIWRPKLTRIPD